MRYIRLGAASLNQTPLDFENNTLNIIKAIEDAKERHVQILCLPELCITGYGCEDAFFFDNIRKTAVSMLNEIAMHTQNIVVCVGFPFSTNNALHNCVAVLADRKLLGIVPKKNLASDGVHYERRWFKPWEGGEIIAPYDIPFGDLVFDIDDVRIGFEICEDAWVANRPGADLSSRCVDVILNPSASHFAFDRYKVRQQFVTEGSRAFRCAYVYSNLVGNEAGRIIYSGDTIIAHNGNIVAEGPRLTFDKYVLTTAIVDIHQNRTRQTENGSFKPSLKYEKVFDWPVLKEPDNMDIDDNCINISLEKNKYDEFTSAVCLGLYDYMRKSKTNGFVVSLSGGVDSTVCALLVHYMYEKYNYSKSYHWNKLKQRLVCVYQRSKNSSTKTELAAENLAKAIKAKYNVIDISSINNDYIIAAEKFVGKQLTWEENDIALQNIQARVRAPSAWLIANIYNYLLLTTSNRSEAAVGYATLDGDTAGGLAPIAGVSKEFLLDWLHYQLKHNISQELKDAIKLVLDLKPTAELRPQDQDQVDENDLMPYLILDKIEKEAIHNKRSPKEVLSILRYYQEPDSHIDDYLKTVSDEQLKIWINKFFKLWCQNQFKRERYAVSFHLDDANLDPKTWCRFPVLCGGFEEI